MFLYEATFSRASESLCLLGSNRSKVKLSLLLPPRHDRRSLLLASLSLSLSLSLSVLYRDFGLARARSKRTNDCAVATVDGGAARRSPNPSPSGKRAHLGGALPHSRECVPTFLTVGTDSLIIHHELLRPPGCGGGAPRRCITIWNAVAVLGSAAQVNPLDR